MSPLSTPSSRRVGANLESPTKAEQDEATEDTIDPELG